MLSTVIDIPSFQKAAFVGQNSEQFEFAVRIEETTGLGGGMLLGKPELFSDRNAVVLEAPTPSGKWVYAVRALEREDKKLVWGIRFLGWLMSFVIGFCVLIVLRQRLALSRLAGFDPLTGLPNRRLFDDRMDQAVRRLARKGENGQVAAVFIDLDDFKPINDKYGHKSGDAVLRIVAIRIREAIRPGDTVSRWAGDEFVVLIEDAESTKIEEMVDRLRLCIELPIEIERTRVLVMSSIGAACYPYEATSTEALLELADQRMYQNKSVRKRGGQTMANG